MLSKFTHEIFLYASGLLLLRVLVSLFNSAKPRQCLLLSASYLFYLTWGLWFLPVLIFSSIVNFALGEFLRRRPTAARLWTGLTFNLLLLSFFKYLPLAAGGAAHFGGVPWLSRIALPLGISFWTFQAISYLLDLYREEPLDPSLLEFCLYMAFWPTVLSGPICRLPNMLPQFRQPVVLHWEDVGNGIQRILMGLFMMILSQVLAAGLGPGQGVDAGFAQSTRVLGGLDVWCLAVGYGFQLFLNFAGYSRIVIGAARIFGIILQENFNHPYLSLTPTVFWTRWHMSLSFWIRDYVFFPLATLRSEMWWRNLCLVIAMFIFGLWHQGSLLFMMWGIYHGLLLVAYRQWERLRLRFDSVYLERLSSLLSWSITFAAVSLGWIFFRAESRAQAAQMFRAVFSPASYAHGALPPNLYRVTVLVAVCYFVAVWINMWLDKWSEAGESDQVELEPVAPQQPAGTPRHIASSSRMPVRIFAALARHRWVWAVPIVAILSLYLLLLLPLEGPLIGPMMYQIF